MAGEVQSQCIVFAIAGIGYFHFAQHRGIEGARGTQTVDAEVINRNVCIDILEKENKHSINVQIDDKIKEISEDYDHIEKLIVADMVEKLPDIYRDVIMMKYFYGFKVNEISKQLHLSVGGVKSRLEKARKILRKDINDDE